MHTRRRLLTLAAAITGTSALAACGADGPDAEGAGGPPPEERPQDPAAAEEADDGAHLSDLDEERRSAWGEGGTAVDLACAQNVPLIGEEFALTGEFGSMAVTMTSLTLHEGDLRTEHTDGAIGTDDEMTHVLAVEAEMRALGTDLEPEIDFFDLGTSAPAGSEWAHWGSTGDRDGAVEDHRMPDVLPADDTVTVRHFGAVPHVPGIEYHVNAPFGFPFQGDGWRLDEHGRDLRAATAETARAEGGGTIAMSRALARAVIERAQWLDTLDGAVPSNGAFLQLEVTVTADGFFTGGDDELAELQTCFALVLPDADTPLEDDRRVLDTSSWNRPLDALVLEAAHPRSTDARLAEGESATFTMLFDAPRTESFSILDATEPRGVSVPGSVWSAGEGGLS